MLIKKILIVDDSSTSRLIIRRCFEIAGFRDAEFAFAGDGLEALRLLDESAIDLIVTDLNMPKCNGLSLIEEMRSRGLREQTKVIVVSSVSEAAQGEVGGGILGVIKKPVSPGKIAALMGGNGCVE